MYTPQPKKLLIINILEILRKYTDEDHRLSQKQIADILKRDYAMEADRKTIKRNLMDLIDFGYNIEYSETARFSPNRKTGENEESTIASDFYMVRDFSDSELRLLIDSLLFSRNVSYPQCRELIGKIEGLSGNFFRSRVKQISTMPVTTPGNQELFLTIDALDDAISRSKQVSFHYGSYGTDKKLHPQPDGSGAPREYIVNPYQMAATNGRYYLIANTDRYDNLSHYRLDRITGIKVLESPAKAAKCVKGLEHGFNLPKHMAEHIYMFPGNSSPVTFRAKRYMINDIIDWFGKDVQFFDETEEEFTVRVNVNLAAMRKWGVQYSVHARILSPPSLLEEVREDLKTAADNYKL